MKKISFIFLFALVFAISLSAETVSYDFNDTSQLSTHFDLPVEGDVISTSSGGIGNTGAVRFPHLPDDPWFWMGETRVVTSHDGIMINRIDEPISLELFINSYQNGGYAALGFSSASSNIATDRCHIENVPAMGMQFYSSGYSYFNNTSEIQGVYTPDIPLSWYKLIYTITPRGSDLYSVNYQLWRTDQNESFMVLQKSGGFSFVNSTIDDGPIYPYFAVDGHRVSYVDNFIFSYPEGSTLPVCMSSFTATVSSETLINLQWTTQSESNILGFNLYRSEDHELAHATKLNSTIIEGTNSSTQHTYNYPDLEFEPRTTYYYWVESVEMNSIASFYGPITVVSGGQDEEVPGYIPPSCSGIVSVYPNPFSPSTEISYELKESAEVTISIYNQKGQFVRTLERVMREKGQYQIIWDGRDQNGRECASGMYLAHMKAGSTNSFYKMLLTK